MSGQARRRAPLDRAQACAPGGWDRPPPATRHRAAGLPRAQSGSAGALRRPASARAADLDRVRGERGERDRGQADDQEAADALGPDDRAALPRRPYGGLGRHARGRFPTALPGLPPPTRRAGYGNGSLITPPTTLHALSGLARALTEPAAAFGGAYALLGLQHRPRWVEPAPHRH